MYRLLLLTSLPLISLLLSNCAPSKARAMREANPLTVGWPGLSYRPTGGVAIGMTGAKAKVDSTINGPESGLSGISWDKVPEAEENERALTTDYVQLNPFLQFFPNPGSAFYLGLGGTYHRATYSFEEETTESTAIAPAYVPVQYESTSVHVGMPLGWAWIWESGFSLTLDFGPRLRISKSYKTIQGDEDADEDKIYASEDRINRHEPALIHGGSGMIGWSF